MSTADPASALDQRRRVPSASANRRRVNRSHRCNLTPFPTYPTLNVPPVQRVREDYMVSLVKPHQVQTVEPQLLQRAADRCFASPFKPVEIEPQPLENVSLSDDHLLSPVKPQGFFTMWPALWPGYDWGACSGFAPGAGLDASIDIGWEELMRPLPQFDFLSATQCSSQASTATGPRSTFMLSPSTVEAVEVPARIRWRSSVHWGKVDIYEVACFKKETFAMTDSSCPHLIDCDACGVCAPRPQRMHSIHKRSIRRVSKDGWVCTTCLSIGAKACAEVPLAIPQVRSSTPHLHADKGIADHGMQSCTGRPLRPTLMRIPTPARLRPFTYIDGKGSQISEEKKEECRECEPETKLIPHLHWKTTYEEARSGVCSRDHPRTAKSISRRRGSKCPIAAPSVQCPLDFSNPFASDSAGGLVRKIWDVPLHAFAPGTMRKYLESIGEDQC